MDRRKDRLEEAGFSNCRRQGLALAELRVQTSEFSNCRNQGLAIADIRVEQ